MLATPQSPPNSLFCQWVHLKVDCENGGPGLFSLAFWATESLRGQGCIQYSVVLGMTASCFPARNDLPIHGFFSCSSPQLCLLCGGRNATCASQYLFYCSTETRCRQEQSLARKSSGIRSWTAQLAIRASPAHSRVTRVSDLLQFTCLKSEITAPPR